MGGCGQTTQTLSGQTTNQPNPVAMQAYENLLARGQSVANLPLQQWSGPTIAGFNGTQQNAFNEVAGAQGAALPYINAAANYAGIGAAPVFPNVQQWSPSAVQQYMNPYTSNVTQATQRLFDEQNAEQFNSLKGSAISAGAFGSDRLGVAQGEMARQQQLAQDPVLAGIQERGYTQAQEELNRQQQLQLQGYEGDAWRAANAAYQFGGLGQEAQGSLLSGASAELQTGALQQQLQQEQMNVPIEQFMQRQAYPFQTTNFLAGITGATAPGMGGTTNSTQQTPGPNWISQVAGLGLSGLGLYGAFGGFRGGSGGMPSSAYFPLGTYRRGGLVPHRDAGGLVPRYDDGGQSAIPRSAATR